jgi:hypothetical protein
MLFTKREEVQLKNCQIIPYYVSYKGMNCLQKAVGCEENLSDRIPAELKEAEDAYREQILPAIRKYNSRAIKEGKAVCIPVFSGHSMGGMLAHAMGAKFRRMSFGFMPLGHGNGIRHDFVGNENWQSANGTDADSHISLITEGDWVSDPKSASAAYLRLPPGKRYVIPWTLDSDKLNKEKGFRGLESRIIHRLHNANLQHFLNPLILPDYGRS